MPDQVSDDNKVVDIRAAVEERRRLEAVAIRQAAADDPRYIDRTA